MGQLQDLVKNWEQNFQDLEEADMLLDMAIEENDLETRQEVEASLDQLKERVDMVELECMFDGEHDASNALLTIHAGAGGTEAQDWVGILMRMYLRWAEAHGFATDILDYLPGDEAGTKSVTTPGILGKLSTYNITPVWGTLSYFVVIDLTITPTAPYFAPSIPP